MSRFANSLGLIAFGTVLTRGIIAGSDLSGTLHTGLITLAIFFGLGLLLGDIARRLVEELVDQDVVKTKAQLLEQLDAEIRKPSAA